jgi:hypothetical protein
MHDAIVAFRPADKLPRDGKRDKESLVRFALDHASLLREIRTREQNPELWSNDAAAKQYRQHGLSNRRSEPVVMFELFNEPQTDGDDANDHLALTSDYW